MNGNGYWCSFNDAASGSTFPQRFTRDAATLETFTFLGKRDEAGRAWKV